MAIRRITPKTREEWRTSLIAYLNVVFDDNPDPELQKKFAAFGNVVSGYIVNDRQDAELIAIENTVNVARKAIDDLRNPMFKTSNPFSL